MDDLRVANLGTGRPGLAPCGWVKKLAYGTFILASCMSMGSMTQARA